MGGDCKIQSLLIYIDLTKCTSHLFLVYVDTKGANSLYSMPNCKATLLPARHTCNPSSGILRA